MAGEARDAAIATITRVELTKRTPTAVAGFDLTFTPTKSVTTGPRSRAQNDVMTLRAMAPPLSSA